MFDYSPAPESKDLVKFQASYGHFIGGKFTKPANTFSTINPATEQVLAEVSHGTAKDVDSAVKAARTAYEKTWSKLDAPNRKYFGVSHSSPAVSLTTTKYLMASLAVLIPPAGFTPI